MKRVGIVLAAMTTALAGCGSISNAIGGGGTAGAHTFDSQSYSTSISTERGSRDQFIVTARPVSASLAGAREAARYEATVYCVNRYGSSAIRWAVGPDSPDKDLTISDDTLALKGTCPQ